MPDQESWQDWLERMASSAQLWRHGAGALVDSDAATIETLWQPAEISSAPHDEPQLLDLDGRDFSRVD